MTRPLALVTRPEPEATATAARLAALGFDALVEPMSSIRLRAGGAIADADANARAVLFTSANAVVAAAPRLARRDLPVFAVGAATAAAARAAGFATVDSADGDAAALVHRVRARLDPGDGALLWPSGADVARDVTAELGPAGYTVRRAVVYEAVAATTLSPEAVAAFADRRVGLVLFFSPRAARTFVMLATRARIAVAGVTAVCLSHAVARAADGLGWAAVRCARSPDLDAMLAAVRG